MKLTNKQQAFISEYLIDLNATQAAIRAGYSENTAKDIGCENLTKPNIQNSIQEAMKKRQQDNKVTRDSVASELNDLMEVAKQNALDGQPAALSSWQKALETKAKLYGLIDSRGAQINIQNNNDSITALMKEISNDAQ